MLGFYLLHRQISRLGNIAECDTLMNKEVPWWPPTHEGAPNDEEGEGDARQVDEGTLRQLRSM
jgi:hypothetical protein